MSDLENGTLRLNTSSQLLLLQQLNWELEAEVLHLNQALGQSKMQEVKNLSTGLKDLIASLKSDALKAKERFTNEATRMSTNIGKLGSVSDELSDANKDIEAVLVETGSNFPTSEASEKSGHADLNGVTLNQAKS